MGCGSSKETTLGTPPKQMQIQSQAQSPLQPQNQKQPVTQQHQANRRQDDILQSSKQVNSGGKQLNTTPSPPKVEPPLNPLTVVSNPKQITSAAPGVWPKRLPQPNMPFVVHVWNHGIANPPHADIKCWTYISEGFDVVRQPEVVFTVRQRPKDSAEDYPSTPMAWMFLVYSLAKAGLNIEPYQMCELIHQRGQSPLIKVTPKVVVAATGDWTSLRSFSMLMLGVPLGLSIFNFPSGVLPRNRNHVIALTDEEAGVAKEFGATRVVSQVGLDVKWFPYPPWVDRDRRTVCHMAEQAGSIRSDVLMARILGMNVMLIDDEIIFTIPRNEEKRMAFRACVRDLPLSRPVGFDSFMASDADAGMTWKAGQTRQECYAGNCHAVNTIHLAFIIFCPQQQKDHDVMKEDGMGILLTDATWLRVRAAIENSQDLVLPLEYDRVFRLVWAKDLYKNPIDKLEYRTTPLPYTTPQRHAQSHVQIQQVLLLDDFTRSDVENPPFRTHLDDLHTMLERVVPTSPPRDAVTGIELVLEILLPSWTGGVWVYPDLDGLPTQEILNAIASVSKPEVQSSLRYQLVCKVWGGEGRKL